MKCQAGFEIERDLCTKCGASNRDICGDMDGEVYSDGLEILALRRALGEIAKQVKSVNLTEDGIALADFPGAYDDMIDVARNALKPNL